MKRVRIIALDGIEYLNEEESIYHYQEFYVEVAHGGFKKPALYNNREIATSQDELIDRLFDKYYNSNECDSFKIYDRKDNLLRMFEKDHQ